MSNQKGLLLLSIAAIFIFSIYGFKIIETVNDKNSVSTIPVAIKPSKVEIIPLILYIASSEENYTAIKIKYNIATKKVEMDPTNLFTIDKYDSHSSYYQWDGNDKMFATYDPITQTSNFIVKNELSNENRTRILELNGNFYKAYGYEKGIALELPSENSEKMYIDLQNENEGAIAFSPLLMYGNDKKVCILVHYYHPSQILNNAMISGLLVTKVNENNKITIDKINMKDQCCVSDIIQPTLIKNEIFINALNKLDKISLDNNCIEQVSLYDKLKKEIKSEPGFEDNDEQPLIGKTGDLLLLCHAKRSNEKVKYHLWAIQNDKLVFRLSTSNNNVFDDVGNVILTTNGTINKILLPNDISN